MTGWRATPLLLVFIAASARGEAVLTLDDAIRIARRNHPTVDAQRAQVVSARGRTEQAAAGLLPYLTGGFVYQPQTPNYAATPAVQQTLIGNTGSATIADRNGMPLTVSCRTPGVGTCVPVTLPPTSWALQNFWTANVGITWTLWDWGYSIYGFKSARALAESARVGVTTAQRNVALDVAVAFFGAIAADEELLVAQDAVADFRRHVEQTHAFHDQGLVNGIDVATIDSGLANVELTLARAGANVAAARAQLAVALGVQNWGDWKLMADPRSFEPGPEDARAALPVPVLSDRALRQRSEVRQLELQALGNERTVKSVRGLYLPQLTLALGPTFEGIDLGSLTPNFEITVALSYPVTGMSPLSVHGQSVQARGNLMTTRAQQRALHDSILQETVDARALLVAANQEVHAGVALVTAAGQQRALAEGRYTAGLGNIIELTDALLNFVNARYQLVQARLDLATARARLQHALGEDAPR